MTHSEHLRRKIRAELAYRGISANKLAPKIGLSQSSLSDRLNGGTDFRIGELEAIARELEMTVADLLAVEPAPGGAR